ncbi:MAG: hypothetical protein IKR89_02840 [Bacteroidaceae bacterium]|nr:hypothetical protein [Bacteroidaceae bacterium]
MDKNSTIEAKGEITSQLYERILSGAASEVISSVKEILRPTVESAIMMVNRQKKYIPIYVSCNNLRSIYELLNLIAINTQNKLIEAIHGCNDDRTKKIMELLNKKYQVFITQKNVDFFDSRLQDYLATIKKYLAIEFCLVIEDFENVSTFFSREDFMTLRPYTDLYVMVVCSKKSISQLEEENYGGEYMENQFESFVI